MASIVPGLVVQKLQSTQAQESDGAQQAVGFQKHVLLLVDVDSPHAEHEGVAVGSVVVLRPVLRVEDGVVAVGQRGTTLRVL